MGVSDARLDDASAEPGVRHVGCVAKGEPTQTGGTPHPNRDIMRQWRAYHALRRRAPLAATDGTRLNTLPMAAGRSTDRLKGAAIRAPPQR